MNQTNGTTTAEQELETQPLIEELLFMASLISGVPSEEFQFSNGSLLLLGDHESKLSEDQKRGLKLLVKNFAKNSEHRVQLKSMGEMASGIAHEISNPLSVIMGHCYNLNKRVEREQLNKESLTHALTKLTSSASRIENILKSMKQFSAPKGAAAYQAVSVTQIITETIDLFEERFIQAGVELKLDAVLDVNWFGNPTQLSQVLFNLLNNSFQAIEPLQEKWITVSLKLEANAFFEIQVRDSGHGIESGIAHKIMTPFFTTKSPEHGTGLGLSICQDIIHSYGGTLFLDTTSQNTCFIIKLPLGG